MASGDALRILVVDDDRDLLDLLKYNFNKEGFRVKTVAKASEALSVAERFRPQLIILDVLLPDGNGMDLCKELRRSPAFDQTVIFFLSACAEKACMTASLEQGADDFIEKLSGLRVLTNKVTAVLKNKFIIKKGVMALSAPDLVIDTRTEVVYYRNHKMTLSKPEFEILFFLMQNPN